MLATKIWYDNYMKKELPLVYIPEIIPMLSKASPLCEELCKRKNVYVLDWTKHLDNYKTFILSDIVDIVDKFLKQFNNRKFNLMVESFSCLIVHQTYYKYRNMIEMTIVVNPFDQLLFFQNFNIKQKLLSGTVTDSIYKYMYLFKTLNGFRDDPKWLKAVTEERHLLVDTTSFYHKILDQLLKLKNIKNYIMWMATLNNPYFVIGNDNPLVNRKLIHRKIHPLKIIKNCGFCIQWEKPQALLELLNDLNKK